MEPDIHRGPHHFTVNELDENLGLILNFVPVSGTQIQIFVPFDDLKNSKYSISNTIEVSRGT